MQLKDITVTISSQTDEELLERLRLIRHNRQVARPVAKAKAEKAEKKTSQKSLAGMDKLIAGLTPAQREQLLKQIEGV